MSEKKIVFWKSTLTGEEGHGKPLLPSIAEAWETYGNEKYPGIKHMADEEIKKAIKNGKNKNR